MSAENEKSYRGFILIFVAAVIGGVFFHLSKGDDGARITTSSSAAGAPQIETRQSLDAMAESYFSGGHYDAAIGVYRKILARDPNDANVLNELGLALHYSAKSDAALEALEKATALDPKLQRAWLSYGFVLKSLGREKQARAALKQTVALGPATPQGLEAQAMLAR